MSEQSGSGTEAAGVWRDVKWRVAGLGAVAFGLAVIGYSQYLEDAPWSDRLFTR